MRNSLYANLKNKRDRNRIIVNYGVRDSESNLCAINVVHAHEVYVLGDSSESDGVESCHDSLNVQCLTIIAKLCKAANRKSLPCNVLFDYKTTYHIFQYANLTSEVTDYVDFHPFNFYDFWARKVLVSGYSAMDNISYQPLDYIPITSKESDKYVHLIIIGMSQMGQAMALQAAHIAHFPNYKKRKMKITFIDRNGKLEMGEFKQKCGELFKVSKSTYIDADAWSEAEARWSEGDSPIDESRYITNCGIAPEYQYLVNDDEPDVVDVEWQFIKGDDHNPVVQRLLAGYASEEDAIVTVAVCLNLMHTSLRSAMHLPKPFYEREVPIPILVQQRKTSTIASTVNGVGFSDEERSKLLYRNIVPFGMVYDCYDLHLAASLEVCKRVNALYDYYFAHNELPSVIDADKSEALWRALPITKQWSNVFVAASVPTKLRSIGIDWSITNPTKLAPLKDSDVALLTEMEHNRWNIEELLMGYRPVKSDEDKAIDADKSLKKQYRNRFIHYDIRPYGCLKEDATGRNSSVYDEVIVRALPLILNELAKNRE